MSPELKAFSNAVIRCFECLNAGDLAGLMKARREAWKIQQANPWIKAIVP